MVRDYTTTGLITVGSFGTFHHYTENGILADDDNCRLVTELQKPTEIRVDAYNLYGKSTFRDGVCKAELILFKGH